MTYAFGQCSDIVINGELNFRVDARRLCGILDGHHWKKNVVSQIRQESHTSDVVIGIQSSSIIVWTPSLCGTCLSYDKDDFSCFE